MKITEKLFFKPIKKIRKNQVKEKQMKIKSNSKKRPEKNK